MTQHVNDKKYGCKIILHRQQYYGSEGKLLHYWNDLSFKTFIKFQWYFQYRAAMVKVEHPRQFVELATFQYDYVPKADEIKKRLQDKLKSAKAKRTEWGNKVERYKAGWNSLFPIEEDPNYKNAMDRIKEKEQSIIDLETQISAL